MDSPKASTTHITTAAMLVVIACVAVVLAGWRIYGAYGVGPGFAVAGGIWFGLSRVQCAALYPINRQRMSVFELLVILAIGFNLFLIALPAVPNSQPPRNPKPAQAGPGPSAAAKHEGTASDVSTISRGAKDASGDAGCESSEINEG